jgi:outer membrane protein
MKRIIGIAALIVFGVCTVGAQTLKFGHVNSEELIRIMPEFDTASVQLESLQTELINTLELMSVELNNKSEQYNKESANLTAIVRQTKSRS